MPVVTPRGDIYETDNGYVLLADMPGVKADQLDVVAERGELIIRGRVDPPSTEPDYKEFELASYERSFVLTDDLETANVAATLRDGVLRVDIPKSERVKPRKIPVKAE
jgi:HSP20 family molecular chaperone IbpA